MVSGKRDLPFFSLVYTVYRRERTSLIKFSIAESPNTPAPSCQIPGVKQPVRVVERKRGLWLKVAHRFTVWTVLFLWVRVSTETTSRKEIDVMCDVLNAKAKALPVERMTDCEKEEWDGKLHHTAYQAAGVEKRVEDPVYLQLVK